MQDIDLTTLSVTELEEFIARAEKIKTDKRQRDVEGFKARVTEEAKEYDIVVTFEPRNPTAKKSVVERRTRSSGRPSQKLRHPDDSALTYSGRGPTPNWLKELRAAGRDAVPVEENA